MGKKNSESKGAYVLNNIPIALSNEAIQDISKKMNVYKVIYNRIVSYANRALEKHKTEIENKEIRYGKDLYSGYFYKGRELTFSDFDVYSMALDLVKQQCGSGLYCNDFINTNILKEIKTKFPASLKMVIDNIVSEKAKAEKAKNKKEDTEESDTEEPLDTKLKYKKEVNEIVCSLDSSNKLFSGIKLDIPNQELYFRGKTFHVPEGSHFKFKLPTKDGNIKQYDAYALSNEDGIKSIAFVRKKVRGNYKWYLRFMIEGAPSMKDKHLGNGVVSIDPAPSGMYVLVRNEDGTYFEKYFPLSDMENGLPVKELMSKEANINRKMARSRRATNPDNYKENGVTKDKKDIVDWVYSKNYNKLKTRKEKISKKFYDTRDISENKILQEILAMGNTFIFEYSSGMVKSWQRRESKTLKDENGNFLKKKRYGKSVMNSAPSAFIQKLKRNVEWLGGTLIEINPYTYGATGFDHTAIGTDKEFVKHDVAERTVTLSNGVTHSRDFHSCFNIMYANPNVKKEKNKNYRNLYDVEKMNKEYENFKKIDQII